MKYLASLSATVFIGIVMSGFVYLAYADFQPVGGTTYRLQTSTGLSANTITLSSFKNRSNIPLTMSLMNTDTVYATIEPQSTNSEFISFTGINQNADGTATLTGVTRGLSDIYPFTASTTLQRAHAGQSVFIVSDSPPFLNEYAIKRNNETIAGDWTITGQWTFDTFPITPSNATSSETVAGVVQLATAAQLAAGTSEGSTGARLVPPNSLATSTYNAATAGQVIPVTSATGAIDTHFLGTTTVQIYATTTIDRGLTVTQGGIQLGSGTSNIASSSLVTFTSSTTPTATWTKKANLRYIIVEVVGGGGGGGASNAGQGASGGGGGGYGKKMILASQLGSTEAVTVGRGGTSAAAGAASSFGSHCSASGGNAGSGTAGGQGGIGSGCDINMQGGGGGAGDVGHTGSSETGLKGGAGGSSFYGGGGNAVGTNTDGTNGGSYGGGGGGGASANGAGSRSGGTGAVGAVFVWEYYF